jgi:hypothetical protein
MSTKKSVFDALLSSGLPSSGQNNGAVAARVNINRIKASRAKEAGLTKDPLGLKSIFGQLFTQMRKLRYEQLRGRKGQQMLSVVFLGEGNECALISHSHSSSGSCSFGVMPVLQVRLMSVGRTASV